MKTRRPIVQPAPRILRAGTLVYCNNFNCLSDLYMIRQDIQLTTNGRRRVLAPGTPADAVMAYEPQPPLVPGESPAPCAHCGRRVDFRSSFNIEEELEE